MKQKNNNRILFWAILAALIIAGAVFALTRKPAQAPVLEENSQDSNEQAKSADETPQAAQPAPAITTPEPPKTLNPQPQQAQGTFSSGETAPPEGPDIVVEAVDYDGSKFTPATVKIKVGDYVFFRNMGEGNFWPASDPHPTHNQYPEFDAKAALGAGKTFKMEFTKAGTFTYHDHLNPGASGTVIVETK